VPGEIQRAPLGSRSCSDGIGASLFFVSSRPESAERREPGSAPRASGTSLTVEWYVADAGRRNARRDPSLRSGRHKNKKKLLYLRRSAEPSLAQGARPLPQQSARCHRHAADKKRRGTRHPNLGEVRIDASLLNDTRIEGGCSGSRGNLTANPFPRGKGNNRVWGRRDEDIVYRSTSGPWLDGRIWGEYAIISSCAKSC
jgi:hypothetical protein